MIYENHYDEIDNLVRLVARKYYKKACMEFEDMTQELWLSVIAQELEDLALINTSLHRRAIDLVRFNYKHNRDRYIEDGATGDAFLDSESNTEVFLIFEDYSKSDVEQSLSSLYRALPEKCKKYFVCKVYAESGLDMFRSEFYRFTEGVPEDIICKILLGESADELIAKHVLGIEISGKYLSKSGTFRRVREDLKKYINTYL